MRRPNWTVIAHIPGEFVGFSVQFFRDEKLAQTYYDLQCKLGNSPTKRPFYAPSDVQYMNPIDAAAFGEESKRPDYDKIVIIPQRRDDEPITP